MLRKDLLVEGKKSDNRKETLKKSDELSKLFENIHDLKISQYVDAPIESISKERFVNKHYFSCDQQPHLSSCATRN